jgi:chemotaxis signal transduction protein
MFLIVESSDIRCALPLESVVEIMRPLPLKHLPQAPAGVTGVALIRGLVEAVRGHHQA